MWSYSTFHFQNIQYHYQFLFLGVFCFTPHIYHYHHLLPVMIVIIIIICVLFRFCVRDSIHWYVMLDDDVMNIPKFDVRSINSFLYEQKFNFLVFIWNLSVIFRPTVVKNIEQSWCKGKQYGQTKFWYIFNFSTKKSIKFVVGQLINTIFSILCMTLKEKCVMKKSHFNTLSNEI